MRPDKARDRIGERYAQTEVTGSTQFCWCMRCLVCGRDFNILRRDASRYERAGIACGCQRGKAGGKRMMSMAKKIWPLLRHTASGRADRLIRVGRNVRTPVGVGTVAAVRRLWIYVDVDGFTWALPRAEVWLA